MRTIWLASYPKSGNTWFRMMVAHLLAENGEPVDINDPPGEGSIASGRPLFDNVLLLDSGLFTHDEAEALRPMVHAAAASAALDRLDEPDEQDSRPAPVRFVKTHDAYTLTRGGIPLLAGRDGADGAILIVRDPRDVAPSLANHNGTSIDAAIDFLNDPDASFCGRTDRQDNQLRQRLPGWSGFHRSWTEQADIPVHVLRYEDMKADPEGSFAAALAFAGWDVPAAALAQAVAQSGFAKLQRQEQERGFREAPRFRPGRGNFFRRGEAGAWRSELSPEQVARVEAMHAPLMRALDYPPSGTESAEIAGDSGAACA